MEIVGVYTAMATELRILGELSYGNRSTRWLAEAIGLSVPVMRDYLRRLDRRGWVIHVHVGGPKAAWCISNLGREALAEAIKFIASRRLS